MSTPNGYNNPAYSHQFDPSLYDYQYVQEIDPDSPDLRQESNRRQLQANLVLPKNFQREPSDSSEFEGSDESNRSVIVEECNNRRVTLICERRKRQEGDAFQGGGRGVYYQDISLESDSGHEMQGKKVYGRREAEEKSFRHQRPLEPPAEQPVRILASCSNDNLRIGRNPALKQSVTPVRGYQRPQRYHRYEKIPYDDDCTPFESKPPNIHRYAEITPDENGYPTLSKQIEIDQNRDCYRQKENLSPKPTSKPRAISPIRHSDAYSPPQTPTRTHQKAAKDFDFGAPRFRPNSPSPIIYSSSPVKTNSFEMSELSPPRIVNDPKRPSDHTFFIQSPKRQPRQPPIGASSAGEPPNERCLLPRNLHQFMLKPAKRCHSLPNSPRKGKDFAHPGTPPGKSHSHKKIAHIFHSSKYKTNGGMDQKNTSARRNISSLFNDHPNDYPMSPKTHHGSPYKPTTTEMLPPKTAVITPIFRRKNQQSHLLWEKSPKGNFEQMSHVFQSTGNIFRSTKETSDLPGSIPGRLTSPPTRIKRNQSVPNFSQTLTAEARMTAGKAHQAHDQENLKYSRNLDLQYSPKKPLEHVSSIAKSRMSLIEQSGSWSNLDSDYHPRCSLCFIFAAVVHLATASATCAISFYLLSKVGRRYYLDFGLLAGFVNFVLGLLGFRSYCWRWIPNRNYVSGFVVLAAFSAFTCGGLSYIITARPMAGHPVLDIMGGAICAVSVLTILLALTGLTMSGCCKTPPPDNRVTDV